VAIDDFGTGYSWLAYLHTLPVKTVKIDRSFVERLGGADDCTPVVKAVIDMSHAMGLSGLAEGVNNKHLGAQVSSMGCDAAQGFYWAHPTPAEEFAAWWREAGRPVVVPHRVSWRGAGGRPSELLGGASTYDLYHRAEPPC
jgi:EAL domain-containing protein (putative c-di-GMP-specific phosphodiesterase class I)